MGEILSSDFREVRSQGERYDRAMQMLRVEFARHPACSEDGGGCRMDGAEEHSGCVGCDARRILGLASEPLDREGFLSVLGYYNVRPNDLGVYYRYVADVLSAERDEAERPLVLEWSRLDEELDNLGYGKENHAEIDRLNAEIKRCSDEIDRINREQREKIMRYVHA